MAKKDDSGETVIPSSAKPGGKPPPSPMPARSDRLEAPRPGRRFPFRLLLWALLMTGTTGLGGYAAYTFYQAKEKNKDDLLACTKELGGQKDAAAAVLNECSVARDGFKDELNTCTGKVSSLEKDSEQLAKMSKDLKATESELKDLRAQKTRYEERMKSVEKFKKDFENLVQAGQLKVRGRNGNLVVSLDSEILFESASAELAKKGEYAIVQVGGVLKTFNDRRFLVVGHTDKAQLKSNTYKDNWDLSVARATKVVRVLIDSGVKAENLIAAGAGEFDPIDDKSFAKNRRIEIVLLPAVAELPPLPEGIDNGK